MKILVITPTLGQSRFLADAVASVAAADCEISNVLVCPPLAENGLRAAYPGLAVLPEESPGVYAAINCGLKTKGDWDAWTWLNDDDCWEPAGIRRAVELLEREPDLDIVYGRVALVDAEGAYLCEVPVERAPRKLPWLLAAGVAAITQQGTLVRRSCIDSVGLLDTSFALAADVDYWARACVAKCRFGFVNTRVANFRLRPGQLSRRTREARRDLKRIVDLHFASVPALRPNLTAAWFRLRRLPAILGRYRRTGCWRFQTLFEREFRS